MTDPAPTAEPTDTDDRDTPGGSADVYFLEPS